MWGTRTALLICDGPNVKFGSHAQPGVVYFVPQQARQFGFDGLGIVYIIAHEWGHQVQSQRLGISTAFDSTQHKEFQADCLAGYFIGAALPYAPDTERRLMSAAGTIGDDRNLHNSLLSGPFGNVIDQYTSLDAHGNGQGRATNVQMGYRDGRQRERGIVSCAVITPNLR
jgi:predicted metalloprotease